MRTLVDIPDDDIRSLDEIAARAKRSRASAVREAVRRYVDTEKSRSWIEDGAGLWKGRTDIRDGLEYQYAIREDRARDW